MRYTPAAATLRQQLPIPAASIEHRGRQEQYNALENWLIADVLYEELFVKDLGTSEAVEWRRGELERGGVNSSYPTPEPTLLIQHLSQLISSNT